MEISIKRTILEPERDKESFFFVWSEAVSLPIYQKWNAGDSGQGIDYFK